MQKILVVLTGGTIGSKIESNLIDVNPDAAYRLLQFYVQQYHASYDEFEVIQPLNTLSENMTPAHWSTLCHALSQIDHKKYSGIIITHGTDTLSYTSALIGYLFHHLPIPVVLVASNYALGEPNSNGLQNFRSAVCLIREGYLKGVYTIFQNHKGENNVYLATRIMEADPYHDEFTSFGGTVLGHIADDHFILNQCACNPTLEELKIAKPPVCDPDITFRNQVLVIRPYPGLDYRCYDLDRLAHENSDLQPKAVLHYLYHSSTACTQGDAYSLLPFIQECQKRGIDFYAGSYKKHNSKRYVTSNEILSLGAIPLMNLSLEAAYMKLLILYNGTNLTYENMMQENIYYESLPPRE